MVVEEQFVVDSKGQKKGVLLTIEQYEKLMEDLHDLAVIAERREETAISLDELKRRLKNDGLL
jgi:PHD/YefM family antitoxin component YafN of YafNO toxin-antitoxin module